jgi:O-antigen/teichoic acid export membrane protein
VDLEVSFIHKYVRVYTWHGLSLLSGFLSILIVIPQLSSRPALFGIYAIVVSLNLLLSYADLGFVSAGFKYACESFARGDRTSEIEVVGFVAFLLLVCSGIFAGGVAYLAAFPHVILPSLTGPEEVLTAAQLLAITALFSPVIVINRGLQIVFGIRVEDYVFQRIVVVGNIVKVISVFWFFRDGHYSLVGYVLFGHVVGLVAVVLGILAAVRRYGYDVGRLMRSIRFSSTVFARTKALALSSMVVTIAWVAYFELDSVFVGRFLGLTTLAQYAVSLSLLSFVRGLLAILFSPFRARINHLVAMGNEIRLREFCGRVVVLTLPATGVVFVSMWLLMRPLISSWVGPDFLESVLIAQVLLVGMCDASFSYPASFLLMAQERVREMKLLAVTPAVLLWAGVLSTFASLDAVSFGLLKVMAIMPSQAMAMLIIARLLKGSDGLGLASAARSLVVPFGFLICVLVPAATWLPASKGAVSLVTVLLAGGGAAAVTLLLTMLTWRRFRQDALAVWSYWSTSRRPLRSLVDTNV